jgi:hypothetical protein
MRMSHFDWCPAAAALAASTKLRIIKQLRCCCIGEASDQFVALSTDFVEACSSYRSSRGARTKDARTSHLGLTSSLASSSAGAEKGFS